MSDNDETYFWGRSPQITYYSKRLHQIGEKVISPKRFMYRVVEGKGGIIAVKEGKEVVLRRSHAGRYQFKATLHEDRDQHSDISKMEQ